MLSDEAQGIDEALTEVSFAVHLVAEQSALKDKVFRFGDP